MPKLSVVCPYCKEVVVVEVGGVDQYYESIVDCPLEDCGGRIAL